MSIVHNSFVEGQFFLNGHTKILFTSCSCSHLKVQTRTGSKQFELFTKILNSILKYCLLPVLVHTSRCKQGVKNFTTS